MVLVAPSILSADFSRLGEEIKAVERAGADWIHIDVMDGHFVPNITIGPVVVKSIRPVTDLTFDVHLMIAEPWKYVDAFAEAGADFITIHAECGNVAGTIDAIKKKCRAGIAVRPSTPLSAIADVIDSIDMLLVMTVNPGFGGQKFMEEVLPKIKEARKMIGSRDIYLQVDGGINPENVAAVKEAGADVIVAGSAVFKSGDYSTAIKSLK
ncbi:MAG: ribulose-phosphate 3-epimerase [Thermoplasmata archaeon]|nr:ribulose-phosphate 3-epimerase [Thermoplasmata archaeon]